MGRDKLQNVYNIQNMNLYFLIWREEGEEGEEGPSWELNWSRCVFRNLRPNFFLID